MLQNKTFLVNDAELPAWFVKTSPLWDVYLGSAWNPLQALRHREIGIKNIGALYMAFIGLPWVSFELIRVSDKLYNNAGTIFNQWMCQQWVKKSYKPAGESSKPPQVWMNFGHNCPETKLVPEGRLWLEQQNFYPIIRNGLTDMQWCMSGCIDGFVQDCSNSSALALELLLSCTKPSYAIL